MNHPAPQKSSLFPSRLFYWLAKTALLVSVLAGLILPVGLFLFDLSSRKDFALGFFLGAAILFPVFFSLFVRLFRAVRRLAEKAGRIVQDKAKETEEAGPLVSDDEPLEFYDINKALNQISREFHKRQQIIRRESSELEAVISAVSGAIAAVDSRQKILFFNAAAALLFDQSRSPGKRGLFLSELVRSPDILQCYEKSLKEGRIVKRKISLDLPGREESRDYELTTVPLKEADFAVQGAVGLFYDITNIAKTERVHVDFISNVSHELRTPLTAVQGYVQTLQTELKRGKTEKLAPFLKIISRNVKRLVALLNHFLELAQMEAQTDLKKERLSTEEITRSIIQDLHIENHRLKLEFSAAKVTADRHFLKQTLYNLIDNAVRYVPKGRLIEVLWSKKPGAVVLTVKDHGKGIPREHRDRLFERFYRADSSRKNIKGVAGVGLSIVKQLMEKHGGSIELGGRRSGGCEFICVFPDS